MSWIPAAIMAASTLANLIFGGGKDQPQQQDTETITETSKTGWQDPSIGFMSPYVIKMLLSNLGSMQGMGMPKGYGGLGMGDWTNDIMAMFEQAWPEIMQGYTIPAATEGARVYPERGQRVRVTQ